MNDLKTAVVFLTLTCITLVIWIGILSRKIDRQNEAMWEHIQRIQTKVFKLEMKTAEHGETITLLPGTYNMDEQ